MFTLTKLTFEEIKLLGVTNFYGMPNYATEKQIIETFRIEEGMLEYWDSHEGFWKECGIQYLYNYLDNNLFIAELNTKERSNGN